MENSILEVKNLKVDFIMDGERVNAVHEVSFKLGKGRTLGIVGESGCGKSVSATSIMRLLPKINTIVDDCTSIKLDDEELTTLSDKEFQKVRGNRISMIFQEPMTSLNPVYTIGKQLIEMVQSHQKISKKDAFETCVEMLEKVGIPEARKRMKEYPHQLSGGMRQRVMIAMALVCNPEVLIADEPTTALDVTIQAQILELMNKLKEDTKTSIILITHDMGVVAEVTDEVMVMYAGEVVEHDDVKEIFHNPMHPYTIGLLDSIPKLNQNTERLLTIDGTVPTLKNMPKVGCRFADRCHYCQDLCRTESPALKKVGTREVRCHFAGNLKAKEDK
ncbi:MAG: ABC transporter ATP-binding protein [Clostridia bacterium]|nr:ABC transporter ATP-binding protein [Clostridia bacterium]